MRGRPKTYDRRAIVTTNIEADLYSFGKDELGIPANEALSSGYIGCIDAELKVTKDIEPADLDRYLEIRNRVYRDMVLQQRQEEEIIHNVSTFAGEVRTEVSKIIENDVKSTPINRWDNVTDEKFPVEYIRYLFDEETRKTWIKNLVRAYKEEEDDDNSYATSDVLEGFVQEYSRRYAKDENKPSRKLEWNQVRRVLSTWADSVRGFQ